MDTLQRIKDREQKLAGLRARQDADERLRHLVRYVMKDADGELVPDIINITLNRPAVFAANVIAALGKVSEQIVVKTDSKSLDVDYIEKFQRACFASANARLRKRGKVPLNPFMDEQGCIRGMMAARVAFQMINGVLVPDIALWDTRYVTWEPGNNGLALAAYSTDQSKGEIMSQPWYDGMSKDKIDRILEKVTDSACVRDVWFEDHNEIFIGEDRVFEQDNPWGFVPVALQSVSLGSNLADKDAIKYHAESIFFLIRDVVPELNRLASIMQTLNLKAVKPPAQAFKDGQPPEYNKVMASGAMTAVGENSKGIATIDYGDAKRAAEIAYKMFDQAQAEGSLPPEAYGSIDIDLSGVALVELGERSGAVLVPRLETKALINQEIAEMLTAQCLQIGGTLEIGTPGHKQGFNTEKLRGEYETTFKYFPKSPKLDMGRYAQAAQAKTVGVPQREIDEEILQVEDPEGRERQRRWEMAEQLSPSIRLHRTVKSLLEDAERGDKDAGFEAELLSAEMGVSLQQMMTGQAGQTPGVETPAKPNPVVALGQGAPPKPPELAPVSEGGLK